MGGGEGGETVPASVRPPAESAPSLDQYRPIPPISAVHDNGLATAAMVCGILWPFCLTAVLAIVFGHRALGQIDQSDGMERGRGQALAGIWLGYLGLASIVLGFVVTSTRT